MMILIIIYIYLYLYNINFLIGINKLFVYEKRGVFFIIIFKYDQ